MQSIDDKEQIICSFYRHWDGYPSGHGQDLADYLKSRRLINGIQGKDQSDIEKHIAFNRAGSMAINLMHHIDEISGCEVIPTGDSGYWEEYTYHIYFRDFAFYISVDDCFPLKVCDFNGNQFEEKSA